MQAELAKRITPRIAKIQKEIQDKKEEQEQQMAKEAEEREKARLLAAENERKLKEEMEKEENRPKTLSEILGGTGGNSMQE